MGDVTLSGVSETDFDSVLSLERVCALRGQLEATVASYGYLSVEGESTTTGMVGKY